MRVITETEVFNDFAMIVEITDLQLAMIAENPSRVETDLVLMKTLIQERGNNAHVIQLTLRSPNSILNHMTRLLKYYDSVSWLHEGRFNIRRRVLCHQP